MRRMRLTRKARYSQSGFSMAESTVLSRIPIGAPYSKLMRADRIRLLRQAVKEGWSKRKYEQAVALQYEARGWRSRGQRLDTASIFRMVRWYEAEWRQTAPPDDIAKWRSPSAKTTHHGTDLNRDKLRRQKREYNAREDVKARRAKYRREHREEIRNAERKRRAFERLNKVGK